MRIMLCITYCFFILPLFSCPLYGEPDLPAADDTSGSIASPLEETPDPEEEPATDAWSFAAEDIPAAYSQGIISTLERFGYRPRGYDRDATEVYVNGIRMNNMETGAAYDGTWRLPVAMTIRHVCPGLDPGSVFGNIGGSEVINAAAACGSRRLNMRYTVSNGAYRNHLSLNYRSGLLKNGWAAAFSADRRWSASGYVPGTSFNGYQFYAAVSRKIGKGFLHFTAVASPATRTGRAPVTREVMDLAEDPYYNPDWGYQDGGRRNARQRRTFQPVAFLSYTWNPSQRTTVDIAVSYQGGYDGMSRLDWYDAPDPRPDYYRNLPGYYLLSGPEPDWRTAAYIREAWLRDPDRHQIDWARLYEANRMHFDKINGVYGRRALYVLGEDHQDVHMGKFAASMRRKIGSCWQLYTGVHLALEQAARYRKLLDLLGADFYVNLNQFAAQTYVGNPVLMQNDINYPDRLVRPGDAYSYYYLEHFWDGFGWVQLTYSGRKYAFFGALRLGADAFERQGQYRNGLFPDNSYGKSERQQFFAWGLKGGISYEVYAHHTFFLRGGYYADAPAFDHIFYSPRTRNATIDHPEAVRRFSTEAGYSGIMHRWKAHLAVFMTDVQRATDILRYYHESYRSFVNYVMQGISIRYTGSNLLVEGPVIPAFSVAFAAAWTRALYTSRPRISIYRDNDTATIADSRLVYWKNYFAATGPQLAGSLELRYRTQRTGYVHIRFNSLAFNYVALNPDRLTAEAVELVPPGTPQWHAIRDEEQLPPVFTADIAAGRTFRLLKRSGGLSRPLYLSIGIGVKNIWNNTGFLAGFQQLRFDYGSRNPDLFPDRYVRGYGRTYFASVGLML